MTGATATLSLIRSAGIYTASRIVNSAIPFLMMPVLTRYLTPADYGIVAMFAVVIGIVTPFVGMNLHGAVGVRYFDEKEKDLPRYIGNCFILLLVNSLLVGAVFWLFSGGISRMTSLPAHWLWTVVLMAAAQFVGLILTTLWQTEGKALRFALFQNVQTVVNVALSLYLVVGLRKNWQGRMEAQLFTVVAFACLSLYILYREQRLKLVYHEDSLRHSLRFGLPLIPHALGGMLIVQTDRMFLTNMSGIATAGIYTVGYQFGSMVELAATSFNQAYAPWLYRQLSLNDSGIKRKIVRMTYLYFGAILLLVLGISLVMPWFLDFFVGREFVGASRYVFWIALGYAFNGMYYMVANYIFIAGRTSVLAWVTFCTALLNIVFNYVLIKWHGPVGAAQASALAFFVSFILTWLLSARVYRMPWKLAAERPDQ